MDQGIFKKVDKWSENVGRNEREQGIKSMVEPSNGRIRTSSVGSPPVLSFSDSLWRLYVARAKLCIVVLIA